MSAQLPLSDFTETALKNLKALTDVNTVIGDPINIPDGPTIIPISKISFGYASGGSDIPSQQPNLFGGGTGGGVTITPIAFLAVSNGNVEILHMQTAHNTGDRIVNTIPGVIDKLIGIIPSKKDKAADAE